MVNLARHVQGRVRAAVRAHDATRPLFRRGHRGQPFRLRLWGNGRVLAEHLLVLTESRLLRAWLQPECGEVLFELVAGDTELADAPWRIRVGVLQQFAAV